MATESSFSKGTSQYNFVVKDLQKASTNSKIKWIIVNYHTPMYTSPNTCSASTCKGSSSLRDIYHPLFDKYGVDIVLQGHVHNYQRTFPIKYNTNSHSSPTKTSTSTSKYNNPQGEIFATIGTGGINFHGLSGKSSFVASQQANKFGILDFSMTNDGTKLTAKYYPNGGSSPSDQFTITKPTTISSLMISTANKVNITNQTSPQTLDNQTSITQTTNNSKISENFSTQTPNVQTTNNMRSADKVTVTNDSKKNNNLRAEVAQILRNANASMNTVTNGPSSQMNNNIDTINDQDNPDAKPTLPKEAARNVNQGIRNIHPDANAGKNQIAVEGSKVILDGSKSKDKDGKIESYRWQQITDPKVALDNTNSNQASFISPTVDHNTTIVFKLTVTDDKGSSDSAITKVKVVNNERTPATLSSNIPNSNGSNPEDVHLNTEQVSNSTVD
jgi:hypothetical protein